MEGCLAGQQLVTAKGKWPPILEKIGKGSFGHVFSVMSNGKKQALKIINYQDFKNPALFECFVMSTFSCYFLQRANQILIDNAQIGIISDLALGSCSKHRKKVIPSSSTLRKWVFSLLMAVNYLHNHKLIHGDIKASNILYFSDDEIRLTDFGLTRPYCFRSRFAKPCSPTHRPLEVWRGLDWDYSVDIWAAGCTIFELAFGYSLFPFQSAESYLEGVIKTTAVLDNWFLQPKKLLPKNFQDHPLSNIILDCLQREPAFRPSAQNLLAKYFAVAPVNIMIDAVASVYELPDFVYEAEVRPIFQQLRAGLDLEFCARRLLLLHGLHRLCRQLAGLKVEKAYFMEEVEVCQMLGFALRVKF